ncbi:cation:proton antiporter [Clostridia bacterium]|nr:cation:proton antiporter [Clostridia bacterium]
MNAFLALGTALILGALCGKIMNKIKMPAVAGYIIAGLLIGVSGFRVLDVGSLDKLSFISDFALCIIAFNIGSELEVNILKKMGRSIFIIATFEALMAFILVTGITYLVSRNLALALILGAVSSATAPAATVMVLKEFNAKGPLTSTLLGIVAVDDVICLMIYSVASAIAKVLIAHTTLSVYKVVMLPLGEIFFSLLLGIVLGVVLALLLKNANRDSDTLLFVVGSLLVLVGVANHFHLSTLLSAMALGATIANLSKHKHQAFENIDNFSPPLIAAFFVLAGARLDIFLLPQIGLIGLMYLVFRIIGKILGATVGASIAQAPKVVKKYIGFGLLSQVGVAVGLAITVSNEFPGTALGTIVVTILLSTTILTEIIGPYTTKYAIMKAGETNL